MSRVSRGTVVRNGNSYDLQLLLDDGQILSIHDVDPSIKTVERFVSGLLGEETDAEQIRYLLEDYLQGVYDGTAP